MDMKVNKLTYQKSRFGIIVMFTCISNVWETYYNIIVGPSDPEFTLKRDKSILVFILLAALIVFK